jgi:hypothetical protein
MQVAAAVAATQLQVDLADQADQVAVQVAQ